MLSIWLSISLPRYGLNPLANFNRKRSSLDELRDEQKQGREERERAERAPAGRGAAGHRSWHGVWCLLPLYGVRETDRAQGTACGAGEAGKELSTLHGCPGHAATPGTNGAETQRPQEETTHPATGRATSALCTPKPPAGCSSGKAAD